MYDIIGDIHGHATPLKNLLSKMDYTEIDGVWQHPERKVIFLGDFIDRGPEQLEVIRIARSMVENGHAKAVMANHEFNAVAWATEHDEQPGEYLRPHSEKNRNQHKEFLRQVGEGSDEHQEIIKWFKTLPLFLDLDEGLRVVHACWHPASLQKLKEYTDEHNRILPGSWPELNRKNTEAYEALEVILKGMEIPLPAGAGFSDKDGHRRENIRIKWWKLDGVTYRDLALVDDEALEEIPHEAIPANILPGYDGAKPLFVGHYWLTEEPAPLNKFIACLDYSIAGKAPMRGADNRKLCGYRWNSESVLTASNFVTVTLSAVDYEREILRGLQIYKCDLTLSSQDCFRFFVAHEHQVACDDWNSDEFEKAFPNFFEYRKYVNELIELLNISKKSKRINYE